jgi:hypothetical protein
VGQERLGPSYFFISLVLGPLNSLLWYIPSSRYVWNSALILFLQEEIKDIIINVPDSFRQDHMLAVDDCSALESPARGC